MALKSSDFAALGGSGQNFSRNIYPEQGELAGAFSDIDKTLIADGAQTVPDSIGQAVVSLHEKSIPFVPITGRRRASALPVLPYLAHGFAVIEGGAIILERGKDGDFRDYIVQDGAGGYDNRLLPEWMHDLKKIADETLGVSLNEFQVETAGVYGGTDPFIHKPWTNQQGVGVGCWSARNVRGESKASELKERILSEIVDSEGAQVLKVERLIAHGSGAGEDGLFNVQVVNLKAEKSSAVRCVTEVAEIALPQVVALGDGHNDLPMLKMVGYPVGVDNRDGTNQRVAQEVPLLPNAVMLGPQADGHVEEYLKGLVRSQRFYGRQAA